MTGKISAAATNCEFREGAESPAALEFAWRFFHAPNNCTSGWLFRSRRDRAAATPRVTPQARLRPLWCLGPPSGVRATEATRPSKGMFRG
jgi:hypothetical protein